MRGLKTIIETVIALIPPDDPLELKAPLTDMADSVKYAAPEMMQMWWNEFCEVLEVHMPYPPIEEWQRSIFRLVTESEPPSVNTK